MESARDCRSARARCTSSRVRGGSHVSSPRRVSCHVARVGRTAWATEATCLSCSHESSSSLQNSGRACRSRYAGSSPTYSTKRASSPTPRTARTTLLMDCKVST
eukprot:5012877-Prymnesium_polylepis.1